MIYGFEGPQTQQGLLDYFSEDNWFHSHVVESDYDHFFETISGEKSAFVDKFWKAYYDLDSVLHEKAKKSFKKMPYVDRWSTNAKIMMIVLGTIPPFLLTVFWIINYFQV